MEYTYITAYSLNEAIKLLRNDVHVLFNKEPKIIANFVLRISPNEKVSSFFNKDHTTQ